MTSKTVSTKRAAALTAFVATVIAPTAHAECCGDAGYLSSIMGSAISIVSSMATQTAQLATMIVGLGKVGGVVENTGKMQIAANKEIAQAQMNMASEIQKNHDIYRLGQDYELPPGACQSTEQIAKAADAINRAQGSIATSFTPGGSRSQLATMPAANASVNAPANTPSELRASLVVAAHGKYFCDTADAASYSGTRYCAGVGAFPGGDVRAESLFAGAKAKPDDPDAFTYTSAQVDAARAYISNATTLVGVRGLSKQDADTRAGSEYLALALSASARINLANKGMFDALARRTPVPEARSLVASIIAGNPAAGAYYSRLPYLQSTGISQLDVTDAEVGRRYRNPQWYSQMAAASPAAVARESAFMQAFQLDLLLKQYLLMERLEVDMGQMLASQVRADAEPKLISKLQELHPGQR